MQSKAGQSYFSIRWLIFKRTALRKKKKKKTSHAPDYEVPVFSCVPMSHQHQDTWRVPWGLR